MANNLEVLFFKAVYNGNLELVERYAKNIGVEKAVKLYLPQAGLGNGGTALHICAEQCADAGNKVTWPWLEIAKFMLQNGADSNAAEVRADNNIVTPIIRLCRTNDMLSPVQTNIICDFIDLLSKHRANLNTIVYKDQKSKPGLESGMTALVYTATSGQYELLVNKTSLNRSMRSNSPVLRAFHIEKLKEKLQPAAELLEECEVPGQVHYLGLEAIKNSGVIPANCHMLKVYDRLFANGADPQITFYKNTPLEHMLMTIKRDLDSIRDDQLQGSTVTADSRWQKKVVKPVTQVAQAAFR